MPPILPACVPIIQLAQVAGGTLLLAPIALLPVVAIKCGIFAWKAPGLPAWKAILLMFLANLISSLFGLLLAAPFAIPALGMITLPLAAVVIAYPAAHLQPLVAARGHQMGPRRIAGILVVLSVLSIALFATSQALVETSFTAYWVLKYGFVLSGITVSMLVTTAWEDATIAAALGNKGADGGRVHAVLLANLGGFLIAAGVAAVMMLPERIGQPGWLAMLLG